MDKKCLECNEEFTPKREVQVFCGKRCAGLYGARKYNESITPEKKQLRKKKAEALWEDPEYREKTTSNMKKYFEENPDKIPRGEKLSKAVGKSTKGKYRKKPPESILELSKRTISKVLRRLDIGCSRCGWSEEICDVHHINGKKIPDPDNHKNLTYICPNCHRLAGKGKIPKEELITLDSYIGDKWKEFYYG